MKEWIFSHINEDDELAIFLFNRVIITIITPDCICVVGAFHLLVKPNDFLIIIIVPSFSLQLLHKHYDFWIFTFIIHPVCYFFDTLWVANKYNILSLLIKWIFIIIALNLPHRIIWYLLYWFILLSWFLLWFFLFW